MPTRPISCSSRGIPASALMLFLAATFLVTWGLIGIYVLAPATAAAKFGEISGSHPFFFLATWSPAIAAFGVVLFYSGMPGLRAFLSRLSLWRCSWGWVAFIRTTVVPFWTDRTRSNPAMAAFAFELSVFPEMR